MTDLETDNIAIAIGTGVMYLAALACFAVAERDGRRGSRVVTSTREPGPAPRGPSCAVNEAQRFRITVGDRSYYVTGRAAFDDEIRRLERLGAGGEVGKSLAIRGHEMIGSYPSFCFFRGGSDYPIPPEFGGVRSRG